MHFNYGFFNPSQGDRIFVIGSTPFQGTRPCQNTSMRTPLCPELWTELVLTSIHDPTAETPSFGRHLNYLRHFDRMKLRETGPYVNAAIFR